jgi:hypothetical protein
LKLGSPNSWKPQGQSRAVMALLCFIVSACEKCKLFNVVSEKTPHPEITFLTLPKKEEYVDILLFYFRFLTRKPMASSQLQAMARVR